MSKQNIVGREEELEILDEAIRSKEAEFIAIYGRRRVGKTFLIREYFEHKGIYIEATGIKDAPLKTQLEEFVRAFSAVFHGGIKLHVPRDWNEAFKMVTEAIEAQPKNKKVILFLDELPWMASRRSKLVQYLDYYWNRHWSSLKNFILITCGSAASWMLDHLIFATGGLYNRITKRILLEPFSLKETELFFESRSIKLKRKLILDLYMVMGGIPFYLKEVRKGKSTVQNINDLCSNKKGLLHGEFSILFQSLFDHAEYHLDIVRAIVHSGNTVSREKLIEITGIPSGGAINRRLDELQASNFIQSHIPYGKRKRDRVFRVIDEYTLFYLKWIEPLIEKGGRTSSAGHWQKIYNTPARSVWAGLAFENICLKHVSQVAEALGLKHIAYSSGSWRFVPSKRSKKNGAQIDLLFDRDDDAITVCEIKYSDKEFVVDKAYARALDQKLDVFEQNFPSKTHPTRKQIYLAMLSPFGVKKNIYSEDLVHNHVNLDDLFD